MTTALSPTRAWQALVPELRSLPNFDTNSAFIPDAGAQAADTAERLLLLLHYSIDWEDSWVAKEKHRKTYWDKALPSKVSRAVYRSATLEEWWSAASTSLEAPAPRFPDRRRELAELLREPPLEVLNVMHTSLQALILRVRIIAEAVSAERKAARA